MTVKRIAAKRKDGTACEVLVIALTEEEYRQAGNDSAGYCLACGAEASCVEPDARRYECEACGEKRVYGTEELFMMGRVTVGDAS